MTREELLEKLNSLQTRLSEEVDSFEIEKRVETIESINEQLKENGIAIEELTTRLSNDQNYVDDRPFIATYYATEVVLQEQEVESKKKAEKDNEQSILHERNKVALSHATIKAGEEEIARLTADMARLRVAIRKAKMSKDDSKIQEYETEISAKESQISEIKELIENHKQGIESHTALIEQLTDLAKGLELQTVEEVEKLEKLKEKRANVRAGVPDLAKKAADQAELDSLIAVSASLDAKSAALSYDFASELKQLKSRFEEGSISEEELASELVELKSRLPKAYITTTEEEKKNELEENRRAQEELEVKIAELESKISNVEGYQDAAAGAKILIAESNIEVLTARNNNYEEEIRYITETNQKDLDSDEEDFEEIIRLCDEENADLELRIAALDIQVNKTNDPADVAMLESLRAKYSLNLEIMDEARELLTKISSETKANEDLVKDLQDRQERGKKIIEMSKKTIENPDLINSSQKRLDEIELQKAQAALEALKNRESYLESELSISDEIDAILSTMGIDDPEFATEHTNENGDSLVAPITFDLEDGVEVQDRNNGNTGLNESGDAALDDDLSVLADLGILSDDADLANEEIGMANNNNNNNNSELDDAIASMSDLGEDEVEVVNSEYDENLKEKSKLKKFVEAAKKHWARIALLIAAGVAVITLLHSCATKTNVEAPNSTPTGVVTEVGTEDENDKLESDQNSDSDLEKYLEEAEKEQASEDAKKDEEQEKNKQNPGSGNSSAPYTEVTEGNGQKEVTEEEKQQAQDDAEKKAKEAEEEAGIGEDGKAHTEDQVSEEDQRKAQEEAERKAREAEEEAQRKAQEEAEKKAKEAEEEAKRQAEEAAKKAEEEAAKKAEEEAKKAEEEAKRKAEEEARKAEEEANKNNDQNNYVETPDEGTKVEEQTGVDPNAEVPADAWDNETPVIDDEFVQSNTNNGISNYSLEESQPVVQSTENVVTEQVSTTENVDTQQAEVQDDQTVNRTAVLAEGEVFDLDGYRTDATTIENDIMMSDAVDGVYQTGDDEMVVALNQSADHVLTDEEIAAIRAANGITDEDILAANEEYLAEVDAVKALNELKAELTGGNENTVDDVQKKIN